MSTTTAKRSSLKMWLIVLAALMMGFALSLLFGHFMSAPARHSATSSTASPAESQAPRAVNRRSMGAAPNGLAVAEDDARRQEIIAELERRQVEQYQAFQRQYGVEEAEPAWAGTKEIEMMEASVADVVRKADAMPRNLSVRCRSSMCRIDADFGSRGIAEDWITLFSTTMGGGMPNMSFTYSTNPDGSTHVEAYGLGRK
jgi:hypothetical protein